MHILHRYVFRDYLVIFCTTLLVNLFVMSMIVVVQAMNAGNNAASPALLIRLFVLVLPYLLMFAVPISALTGCLILFGRLSFDGEITAMRASGLSMWNIIAPIVMFSVLLSVVCMINNAYFAPLSKESRRDISQLIREENPLDMLTPYDFTKSLPGVGIYIGSRDGNVIHNVHIFKYDEKGLTLDLRAKQGAAFMEGKDKLVINLRDVRVEQKEKGKNGDIQPAFYTESYPYTLDLSAVDKSGKIKKPDKMTLAELLDGLRDLTRKNPDASERFLNMERAALAMELNSRFSLALSCFAFTLIGIPLGMKSRRKESSVGIGIALGLVLFYYLFIILSKRLVAYPELRPDLVIWIPMLVCEVLGFYLLYRIK